MLSAALAASLALAASAAASARPLNVLVIGADTLRADHLGLYGCARPTSPNLDRLAARGVVFERAYAQGGYTLPSFASLFTSRYPEQHRALHKNDALGAGETTLAELFRRAGYRTGALTGGPYLSFQYGLAKGFDDYVGGDLPRPLSAYVPEALRWIAKDPSRPFFLFVQPQDVHPPFDELEVPEAERGRFDPGSRADVDRYAGTLYFYRALNGESWDDNFPEPPAELKKTLAALAKDPAARRRLAALYDDRVARLDRSLGAFLDELARRGVLEDTVVVFLSDHGTLFGEGGRFAHGLHESTLDAIFRVALVVWAPGLRPRRVRSSVELVDVAPTLARLAGLAVPASFEGRDLAPLLGGAEDPAPRPVFGTATSVDGRPEEMREFVYDGRWKLVLDEPGGRTALYDVAADPEESADVKAAHAPEAGRLSRLLSAHLQRLAREAP